MFNKKITKKKVVLDNLPSRITSEVNKEPLSAPACVSGDGKTVPSASREEGLNFNPDVKVAPQQRVRASSVGRHVEQYRAASLERCISASEDGKDDEVFYTNNTRERHGHGSANGKRQIPRRHTVTVGVTAAGHMSEEEERDWKREAFMELLAQRYPDYADKISGTNSENGYPMKPRSREHPRRQTIVTYNPDHNRSVEYDSGTMSDVDLPPSSFQRGGFGRSSLPIVRSASSSFDRPLGLVFLIFKDETRKALLPNEITTLDTVRALFVRSFPEKLTMEYLESPRRKIYVLEPKSNIYFQLEDLRDIKDRTVLRIHECESKEPQKVKEQPAIRGRTVQVASMRPPPKPAHTSMEAPVTKDDYARTQSLPSHIPHNYQTMMDDQRAQWEAERRSRSRSRSRSRTPEPERPRTLTVAPSRPRVSPDRLPTPERVLLGTIPEHHQIHNGHLQQMVNGSHLSNYEILSGYRDPRAYPAASPSDHPPTRAFSPQPSATNYENVYGYHQHAPGAPPQTYVAHGVRANAVHVPQRATTVPPVEMRNSTRNGTSNRHSLTFVPMSMAPPVEPQFQRSGSYRVTPEREPVNQRSRSATPQPSDFETKYIPPINRIDKMEAQLASLTAWVHNTVTSKTDSLEQTSSKSASSVTSDSTETFPGSTASSMSDIAMASCEKSTGVSKEMKNTILVLKHKTSDLKGELRTLRRMHQLNNEAMSESIQSTFSKIKSALLTVPGANSQLVRQHRWDINNQCQTFNDDKARIEKELIDLEASVEELRSDIISRQCRVNMADVEGMAVMLSNITKALADLKARFPKLQSEMKRVMAGEMEIVVQEEKFLKDEPDKIESALKRCKKLTGTLYTLKRLASVQEHRPPQVPGIAHFNNPPSEEDKKAVLENIRAVVPDHSNRLQSLEAAEFSRERKKKISTSQEALKFGKTLELASKALKPAGEGSSETVNSAPESAARDSATPESTSSQVKVSMPLTSMTEKISNVGRNGLDSPAVSVSHTVLVSAATVGPSDTYSSHRHSARAAFFSSLSPPTSPSRGTTVPKTTMDYTVRISPSRVTVASLNSDTSTVTSTAISPTSQAYKLPQTRPNNLNAIGDTKVKGEDISPTRSRSTFTNIPRGMTRVGPSASSGSVEVVETKPKKVPPPPPPRKSSRLPMSSVSSGSVNGNVVSPIQPATPEGPVIPNLDGAKPTLKNKDSVLTVYRAKGTARSGPVSSTPKPPPPKKPVSLFEKDLVAGIYSNMNRPDLQSQKVPPERIINKVNYQEKASKEEHLLREDRESSSESTSSSASLDSQQGGVILRRTGSETANSDSEKKGDNLPGNPQGKKVKPKPEPPERRSSLLQKKETSNQSPQTMSEAQHLQEQHKKLEMLVMETNEMMRQQQILSEHSPNKPSLNGGVSASKTSSIKS